MADQPADYEALNKELGQELLQARAELLSARKRAQYHEENAGSLSARLDEMVGKVRTAEAAQRQAEGNLLVVKDSIPPLQARIAKLEGDLRFVADALTPVHEKAQALRPE